MKKVLIVDGSSSVTDVLKDYFDNGEFCVAVADSVNELNSVLEISQPDIIFWGNKLSQDTSLIDGVLQNLLEKLNKDIVHIAMSSTHYIEQGEIFKDAEVTYLVLPKTVIFDHIKELLISLASKSLAE